MTRLPVEMDRAVISAVSGWRTGHVTSKYRFATVPRPGSILTGDRRSELDRVPTDPLYNADRSTDVIGSVARYWHSMRDSLSVERTPEGRRVVISRRIDAPPSRVWKLLVDTRRWTEWGPSISAIDADHVRIEEGTNGQIRTVFGIWLPFTITRLSEWSWSWRIANVPATGHRVIPEESSCQAVFEVPLVAFPYLVVCWVALRRIQRLATA